MGVGLFDFGEFLLCPGLFFLVALAVLILGGRIVNRGESLVILGWIIGVFIAVAGWAKIQRPDFLYEVLSPNWLGSQPPPVSISLGLKRDPLSLMMVTLGLILLVPVIVARKFLLKEMLAERLYSGLSFCFSGYAVSWMASTPWMAWVGVGLCVLGGFIACSCYWVDRDDEAKVASRYLAETYLGLLVGIVGACVVASQDGVSLSYDLKTWGHASPTDHVGATLLMIGAFLVFRPFPFLGWTVGESKGFLPIRFLCTSVFPGLSALAILVRLEPALQQLQLLHALRIIALVASGLALAVGTFQQIWYRAALSWYGATLCLSVAVLASSGTQTALAIAIGASVSVLAVFLVGSVLPRNKPLSGRESREGNTTLGTTLALVFSTLAMSGGPLFLVGYGVSAWLTVLFRENSFEAVLGGLNFFLFVMVAWKIFWSVNFQVKLQPLAWNIWLGVVTLLLCALAATGTGTFTGIFGSEDVALFGSLLERVIPNPMAMPGVDPLALGVYLIIFIIALGLTAWLRGTWGRLEERMPRMSHFFGSGFLMDVFFAKIQARLVQSSNLFNRLMIEGLWERGSAERIYFAMRKSSNAIAFIDLHTQNSLNHAFNSLLETAGKGAQKLQNGSVQWYLAFGIGSGLVFLLYNLWLLG